MLGDFKGGMGPALLIILTALIWVHGPLLHDEADISAQGAPGREEGGCEAWMSDQSQPGQGDSVYLAQSLDADVKSREDLSGDVVVSVIVKLKGDAPGGYGGGIPSAAGNATEAEGGGGGKGGAEQGRPYSISLEQRFQAFETAVRESIPESKIIHRFRTETGHVHMLVPINRLDDLVSLPGVDRLYPDECCLQ